MIGQILGHYRILEMLGAGGMGEVYRAEDMTLRRHVALKVLPSEVAGSREKLERFRREAETLAALDHPNIVTLYSIESDAEVHFLTMQLVEGRPLDEVIPAQGMTVQRAVAIGIALTEALRVAHEKGVIHRDLKPANVMIDQEGRVKILDFGLAKLRRSAFDEDSSRMETEAMTREGVILGTIPYMSPEQIQGASVDRRTDLYSLGVMLHEMLCGQRPFQATNTAALMSSILRDPPTPVGEVRSGLPEKLVRVLENCLEKDPLLRVQSADQLWLELKEVQAGIGGAASAEIEAAVERVLAKVPTGQAVTAASEVPSEAPSATPKAVEPDRTVTSPRDRRGLWRLAIASSVVGILLAITFVFVDRERSEPARDPLPTRFEHRQLTAQPGVEQIPSLSPDGQWVIYSGEGPEHQDIFLQSVGGQNPFNLTEGSGADDIQPAFSPDGDSIAFRSNREGGGLFIMGRTGEAVRRVTRDGFNPSWSPDGGQLAFSTESVGLNPLNWQGTSAIGVVQIETGELRMLTERDGVEPAWSPNGHRVAFVSRRGGDITQMDIVSVAATGGERVPVTTDPATDWGPTWSPDGHYLFFASDRSGSMNLWRIAVDERSGEPLGEPEPVTTPATYLAHPTLDADGARIAYSSVLMTQNIQSLELVPTAAESTGRVDWVTSGSVQWSSVDVSTDGEWLVFYSRARPEGDLYVARADGSGLRQLTSDEAIDRVPRWSPNGEWISCFSNRSGSFQIWRIRRDGSDLEQLTSGEPGFSLHAWSPDGTRIAAVRDLGPGIRTLVFDTTRPWSEQEPQVLPPIGDSGPPMVVMSWSPDGTMLTGQAGYPGVGVIVYAFATESYRRLTDFGEWPVWLPDNRRILFVYQGKHFFTVDIESGETREVFTTTRDVIGPPRIPADASRVFFSRRVTEADIWLLSLVPE